MITDLDDPEAVRWQLATLEQRVHDLRNQLGPALYHRESAEREALIRRRAADDVTLFLSAALERFATAADEIGEEGP